MYILNHKYIHTAHKISAIHIFLTKYFQSLIVQQLVCLAVVLFNFYGYI